MYPYKGNCSNKIEYGNFYISRGNGTLSREETLVKLFLPLLPEKGHP